MILAAPFAAKAGGEVVKREMVARAPRDTGALANSITVSGDGPVASVGATVPYDVFVQLGTKYQDQQPYGEEGARANTSGVVAAMAAIFKQAVE